MYYGDGFDESCYCMDVRYKEKKNPRMTLIFLTWATWVIDDAIYWEEDWSLWWENKFEEQIKHSILELLSLRCL